jgi:hypothetical protein
MVKPKKLTQKDFKDMWGDEGPYSEVRLCEETRILDERISRIFLVVEANINPFTFEYVEEHREKFKDDKPVLQLLDHAVYVEDNYGYLVSAGQMEMIDMESHVFARQQAEMTIATLIRMHEFVMEEHGLDKDRFKWNKISDVSP